MNLGPDAPFAIESINIAILKEKEIMIQSLQQLDTERIPRHIAIIMDGNGRWARSRGSKRTEGHIVVVDSVKYIITAASDLGVEYLTLYAFSTENWNRPNAKSASMCCLWQRTRPEFLRKL